MEDLQNEIENEPLESHKILKEEKIQRQINIQDQNEQKLKEIKEVPVIMNILMKKKQEGSYRVYFSKEEIIESIKKYKNRVKKNEISEQTFDQLLSSKLIEKLDFDQISKFKLTDKGYQLIEKYESDQIKKQKDQQDSMSVLKLKNQKQIDNNKLKLINKKLKKSHEKSKNEIEQNRKKEEAKNKYDQLLFNIRLNFQLNYQNQQKKIDNINKKNEPKSNGKQFKNGLDEINCGEIPNSTEKKPKYKNTTMKNEDQNNKKTMHLEQNEKLLSKKSLIKKLNDDNDTSNEKHDIRNKSKNTIVKNKKHNNQNNRTFSKNKMQKQQDQKVRSQEKFKLTKKKDEGKESQDNLISSIQKMEQTNQSSFCSIGTFLNF